MTVEVPLVLKAVDSIYVKGRCPLPAFTVEAKTNQAFSIFFFQDDITEIFFQDDITEINPHYPSSSQTTTKVGYQVYKVQCIVHPKI
ncbi:hypothetical protein J6590_001793 [Homalodisca vitripennis]|nr:hypothetical protein J6590_001793 [Homalodisca vitripennis]